MAESTGKKNRYRGSYQQPSGQPNANAPVKGNGSQQTGGSGQTGDANKWQGGRGQGGRGQSGRGQGGIDVAITSDLMTQAELYYKAAYEAQRNAAQQTHDESQLLLDQQLAGLQATYDQQREQSRENYAQAYSQADRQSLSRGMQRSSYNNATLGNISIAGNEAQQAINDTQAQQTGNLQEQKTLYGRQLQQTLESLTKQEQSDILAKVDDLKRRQEELNIQKQQLSLQQQQMQMEYQMWLAEFNAKYGNTGGGGGGSSGGSSGGSGGGGGSGDPTPSIDDFYNKLGLGGLGSAGTTANKNQLYGNVNKNQLQ